MKKLFFAVVIAITLGGTPALAKEILEAPVLPWNYVLPPPATTVIDLDQPVPIALPVKKAEIAKPPSVACGEVGRWKVFLPTDSCSGMKVLGLYRY